MPTPYLSRAASEQSGSRVGTPRSTSVEPKAPIDWDTNVVNFISACRHPGLVRRTSFGTAHASQDTSLQRKHGHRRNLSAVTTIGYVRQPELCAFPRFPPYPVPGICPQWNNYNSVRQHSTVVPLPLYGHTRNISDPTSCWEQYRTDHKQYGAPVYFDPTVYPVLSLSHQLSANSPERLADDVSISGELKSQVFPYGPMGLTEFPCWEEEEAKAPEPCTLTDSYMAYGEQCLCTCLQPCATPLTVLLGLSFIMFVQTMVASGLISSMLTTLEQRFNFTSRQMGYMISCFEGSGVLTTVAVSFVNGRKHNRLRIVGLSTLLVSFGFALFTVPHFLVGPYEPQSQRSAFVVEQTSSSSTNFSFESSARRNSPIVDQATTQPRRDEYEPFSYNSLVRSVELAIFCISMVLAGVGGSPINVLGPTYLWDNLSAKQYPIYSALFYSAGGLGPACGFLAGAGFLSVFIDYPFRDTPAGFTRNDPLWLGNWWLGILICAAVSFAAACPVMAFPKRLTSKHCSCPSEQAAQKHPISTSRLHSPHRSKSHVPGTTNANRVHSTLAPVSKDHHRTTSESVLPGSKSLSKETAKQCLSDLRRTVSVGWCPRKSEDRAPTPVVVLGTIPNKARERIKAYFLVLRRVVTNPVWFGVTFTSMVEHSVVAAFLTFVSKYIQGLFQVPAYMASIHTGAVVVPSSLLGVLSGALFMRHYRPRIDRALIGIAFVIGGTVLTTISLMLIGCPSNRLAGVTASYDGRPWPWVYGPVKLLEPNLTARCKSLFAPGDTPSHVVGPSRYGAHPHCSTTDFRPVCWQRSNDDQLPAGTDPADLDADSSATVDQMTFFNPCFAGCSGRPIKSPNSTRPPEFRDCTCVTAHSLNPLGLSRLAHRGEAAPGRVTAGRCPAKCSQYTVFLAILFIHILLTGALQNPSNVITLSCVSPDDSSVALGLQVFIMRTLAYIPAPIYFGQLFDLVCQLRLGPSIPLFDTATQRNVTTGEPLANSLISAASTVPITPHQLTSGAMNPSTGACLQYNLEGLPLVWLGLVLALKVVSLMGAIFTWHIARHRAVKPAAFMTSDQVDSPPPAPKHPDPHSSGIQSLPSLREPNTQPSPDQGLGELASPNPFA